MVGGEVAAAVNLFLEMGGNKNGAGGDFGGGFGGGGFGGGDATGDAAGDFAGGDWGAGGAEPEVRFALELSPAASTPIAQ